ncbi:MAG: hypothetical protein SGJ01_02390 [Gemmatimonadota bacterium]|nr:hypothetical protein [Gemmatimonadota bacterium]
MARTKRVARGSKKVQKNFRLAPDKIAAAQRILGASTATATIETALDLVILRQNLIDGTRAMFGRDLSPPSLISRGAPDSRSHLPPPR